MKNREVLNHNRRLHGPEPCALTGLSHAPMVLRLYFWPDHTSNWLRSNRNCWRNQYGIRLCGSVPIAAINIYAVGAHGQVRSSCIFDRAPLLGHLITWALRLTIPRCVGAETPKCQLNKISSRELQARRKVMFDLAALLFRYKHLCCC